MLPKIYGGSNANEGNTGDMPGDIQSTSTRQASDKGVPHRGVALDGMSDVQMRRKLEALNAGLPRKTPTPTPVSTPRDTPTSGSSGSSRGAASSEEVVEAPSIQPAGVTVYVTFYSCPPYCGDPSGPLPLGEGQAACDWAYMGRRFRLNGQEWICNDTGGLVHGAHVDLFYWNEANGWVYLAKYGTEGELEWLD